MKTLNGVAYLDENQNIKIINGQESITNLDSLPFPQRPYLEQVKKRHSTVNMLTSRGCMGSCTFCSISSFLKKQNSEKWRGRSLNDIIKELKELQKLGVKTVKFVDDSFIENDRDEQWCKNFNKLIKDNNININFRASIRADKVNAENMKYLREAGFFSFSCGIENGSQTALKRMAKHASIEDNKNAIKIFDQNGMYVQCGFILFDDDTTLEELEENYNFLNENIGLITKGIFSEMYAAEGTAFTNKVKKDNNEKFAANNIYKIKDEKARKVYESLKKWQIHNSKLYDMIIDPISAPKDIEIEKMEKYHKLMIEMKKIDLLYMREVLNKVRDGKDEKEVYNKYINKYSSDLKKIHNLVQEYYKKDNLEYDANINGFLTINDNNNKKVIIICRHGESYKNLKDIYGGKGESLTPQGIEQINKTGEDILKIAEYLKMPVNVYMSTDRVQVKQSAQIIAQKLNTILKTDDGFQPIKLGAFNGMSSEQQRKEYPDAHNLHVKWQKGLIDITESERKIEGAQSALEYYNQIEEFIEKLDNEELTVLVGTRSDAICLSNVFRGQTPEKYMSYKFYSFDYGQTEIMVERGNKKKIYSMNDIIEKIDKRNAEKNNKNVETEREL